MRNVTAMLFAVFAATPALAERVNFTVSPGQGRVLERIDIVRGSPTPPSAPTPDDPKPDKPRKPRAQKPACDAALGLLDTYNTAKGECEKARAELAGKVDGLETCVRELEKAAKAKPAEPPAPPPAAPKPQGRGSSRGRGALPAAASPQPPADNFELIKIKGRLSTP